MIHNSHNNLSLKVLTAGHDVEVAAHKNVLAACSPYFYAMFTGFTEKVRAGWVRDSNQKYKVALRVVVDRG